MDADESLARMQGLYADLLAFAEARLPNLERLWAELEDSITDFRTLLDHKSRSDGSRRAIGGDTVSFDGTAYSINDEFRQEAIQIADELDLDEVEACKLLLEAQDEAQPISRPPSLAAIFRFHSARESLLGCLRITFHEAQDPDIEPEHRENFGQIVRLVAQQDIPKSTGKSSFFSKCLQGMISIEATIRKLRDRLVSISVIGESIHSFAVEAIECQRVSLVRQHENLGGLLCSIVKLNHATLGEYQELLKHLATLEILDEIVAHYLPVLITSAAYFGSSDGAITLREARAFDQNFADQTEATRWNLPDFRAAAALWWLSEYSGRYIDLGAASPLEGVNQEKESEARSDRVMQGLKDGAFQFILLICSRIRSHSWHDPARTGLLAFLLSSYPSHNHASLSVAQWFEEILADQLQIFIEAFIGNMPDTIRRLKSEEDDKRRNLGSSFTQPQSEPPLHLERFLTIISFAFSGSPDQAMEAFWSDPDGNMYGFVQWASKRQSTPRAAAFCEMFQAIAESDKCAEAAHKFLSDDASATSSAKIRRSVSLSWSQIFSELTFYAERLRDRPDAFSGFADSNTASPVTEPESALMLECYLRLTTHMCRTSSSARDFILTHPEVRLHDILFDLCRSSIESRFKACAFVTLASMLTEKTIEVSFAMWDALDQWTFGMQGNKTGSAAKPMSEQTGQVSLGDSRLQQIASGFEESNAFVRFMQSLTELPASASSLNDCLPFNEGLGSNYRMPGIDQYVDFVLGSIMTGVLPALEDEQQTWELRCACLDFIQTCLSGFNQDLVIFANISSIDVDTAISTSSLAVYSRLHPFARVMEWMFNDRVVGQLFACAHVAPEVLTASDPDSPIVTSVTRAVQVIGLILQTQTTYCDIVRPLIKLHSQTRSRQVANPTLATFEDAILTNLDLVVDLALYCSTGFEHLTTLSLELLQQLSVSRKFRASPAQVSGRSATSRLLVALQQTGDVDRISASFAAPLTLDPREMEAGTTAPGYSIKMAILDLLDSSLRYGTGQPVLAHCLLGLTCNEQSVSVASEGPFVHGVSVFHAIARLYAETANVGEPFTNAWLATLRSKAGAIIRKLCRSAITSTLILRQLRESGFKEAIAISQQPLIEAGIETQAFRDPSVLLTDDADFVRAAIIDRAIYFEQQALELREAMASSSLTLQSKAMSSLLGLTVLPTGEQVQHSNILDLFDFFDDDFIELPTLPPLLYMKDLDFDACTIETADDLRPYDMRLVREMLLLREASLRKSGQLDSEASMAQAQEEVDSILLCLSASNQGASIRAAQRDASTAWVQLVTVMVSAGGLGVNEKQAFVNQTLQLILPKIDAGLANESLAVVSLLRLALVLLRALSTVNGGSSTEGGILEERTFATFRSAITAITVSLDSPDLREVGYKLLVLVLSQRQSAPMQRNTRKTIESAGERLLEIVTDDALSSSSAASVAALTFIAQSIDLFSAGKSEYLIRSLTRLNFVSATVDTVRSIPSIFAGDSQSRSNDLFALLRYVQSSLDVLIKLARNVKGADALLESGLFAAVRDCGLFGADPDLGDVDGDVQALNRYYDLLAGILQVIATVVLVKGNRNENVLGAGRRFLLESRSCIVAALKASRRPEGLGPQARAALGNVIDGFQAVMSGVDFIEYDDKPASTKKIGMSFT